MIEVIKSVNGFLHEFGEKVLVVFAVTGGLVGSVISRSYVATVTPTDILALHLIWGGGGVITGGFVFLAVVMTWIVFNDNWLRRHGF